MKRATVAVVLAVLLGAFAVYALPPPALAHHQPVAHVHSLTGIQPVMLAAEQPVAVPATYFIALIQSRASPVYAYAVFRPDGSGFAPGGDRDSVASLSPPFTVLTAMSEKGFVQHPARADPANAVCVFRDVNARSPPLSIWT